MVFTSPLVLVVPARNRTSPVRACILVVMLGQLRQQINHGGKGIVTTYIPCIRRDEQDLFKTEQGLRIEALADVYVR